MREVVGAGQLLMTAAPSPASADRLAENARRRLRTAFRGAGDCRARLPGAGLPRERAAGYRTTA
ncbi:hypothetical protein [Streptomyces resistomycificus]|uniref:Uncharacterized protein n=1 Tax=Streptomyces resistomycificus TaxID=67356 RepID=A0A0L8KTU1_9ACTN|nr:hypothetical protein [Streptomyces resistomycificus]KOG29373.1 hypothetical protein ADK37_37400 [Streptomyces resistomycificus]KUO01715.1 hypothetical protein AQJ84_04610 [Streptomyces resistomycificus]